MTVDVQMHLFQTSEVSRASLNIFTEDVQSMLVKRQIQAHPSRDRLIFLKCQ